MKMYCIFARESIEKMGGNRGKLAAQAGHAFLGSYLLAKQHADIAEYEECGSPKICVVVDTVAELESLHRTHAISYLVKDAGRTVFAEPTVTCLGVGPYDDDDYGSDITSLKVLL